MPVRNKEIKELSENIRKIIDGKDADIRDNKEGCFSILKNDIHTLSAMQRERITALKQQHSEFVKYMEDISHQIKTPVASMMIMADLLEDAPPNKRKEFTENIKNSLNHMDWLVSGLLKLAKLDAGCISFEKKPVSSADLIQAAEEPLSILLDVKDQTLVSEGEVEFLCDRRWTAEALTNIIKNASEHSPEHSVIRIACGANPVYRWISVTDAGEGIPKEMISRVFTRFDNARGSRGYGIGLSLAYSVLRSQNGTIDVDGGGRGKGAAFTLKFFQ